MKHYHTLKRVKTKDKKELFMCADSECTWIRRKEYLVNKKFKCPLCGEIYIVTVDMLRRKLPHCHNCTASVVKEPRLVGLLPIREHLIIETRESSDET